MQMDTTANPCCWGWEGSTAQGRGVYSFGMEPIANTIVEEIKEWFDTLENFTGIKNIKDCYVSVLEAKCSIPWHVDDNHDILTKSFITAIRTQSSFIEFKDRCKYTYKTGYSYALNTSQQHRVLNLSNLHRITLCVTPEENKYV